MPAKFWRLTGWTNISPRNFKLILRCIAFRIYKACYRRKSTVSPGKLILLKKTPLKRAFWGDKNELLWVWEELEAKPFTTGQLLGYPWKLMDITLQMSYVEAWWHQNWVHSRPILCRGGADADISENLFFFIKRSVAPNLQIETFLGPAPTDSPRTQLSEYL